MKNKVKNWIPTKLGLFLLTCLYLTPALGALNSDALNKEIVSLYKEGKLKEAIQKASEAESTLMARSEDQVMTQDVNLMVNIAMVYKGAKNTEKAILYLEKATQWRAFIFGKKDPVLAKIFNNLGNIYYQQLDYEKARQSFQKALDIRVVNFGEDHLLVSNICINLGQAFEKLGAYEEAYKLFNKSFLIRKEKYGLENAKTASALFMSGKALYYEQNYKEAEGILKKVLKISEDIEENCQKMKIMAMDMLAATMLAQKRVKEAKKIYKKVLKIRESLKQKDDIEIANTKSNLASCYMEENSKKAEGLLKEALETLVTALGEKDPKTESVRQALSQYYDRQKANK